MIKIKFKNGNSPRLFIDRLVVKLDFLPGQDANQTHNALFPLFDDPECFSGTKPANTVQIEKRIVLSSVAQAKHHPHFIYRYGNCQAVWMRLTLHPRDMGLQGFEELHSVLGMFTENGWGSFVNEAKVTQIEVSIDLEGIPFNSVNILPDQAETMTVYKSGKQVETIYLGKTKSNQTKVYDRALKRKKLGQEDKAEPCTRIERVKTSPNLLVRELDKLSNPFDHVKFVSIPVKPPTGGGKEYFWNFFCDSVAQRGLDPALKLLPPARRATYRKYLATKNHHWWLPKTIWSSWPKLLDDLKLTDTDYWS